MTGNVSGKKLGLGAGLWMVGGESGRFIGPLVIGAFIPLAGQAQMPWLIYSAGCSPRPCSSLRCRLTAASSLARGGASLREELAEQGRLLPSLLGLMIAHVIMSGIGHLPACDAV